MEMMENCYIPNNPAALHYLGLDFEPLIGTAPSTPPSVMMQLTAGAPQSYYPPPPPQQQQQQQHHHHHHHHHHQQQQHQIEQPASTPAEWGFNCDEMMMSAATDGYNTASPVTPTDLEDTAASTPNFFQFSPCSPSNASNASICKGDLVSCFLQKNSQIEEIGLNVKHEQQPTHDMADVLLSLKHAIVHPGQISPSSSYTPTSPNGCYHHQQFNTSAASSSASLSCTVYPHQLTPLPMEGDNYDNGIQQCPSYFNNFTDPVVASAPAPCGNTLSWSASHTQPIFHGMSVNVSMNMTMHHAASIHQDAIQHPLQCHSQMQWTSLTPNPSPVYQNQNLLSPVGMYSGNGSGYPFSADIKPQPQMDSNFICASPCSLKSYNKQFPYQPTSPPLPNSASCAMKVGKRNKCENNAKHMTISSSSSSSECEIGKPNLCRICGKTYARPSTLKTHLRTHSGEKPYRCDDCNKSFSQAANLTAHVRTHSGEKPFKCLVCDRRFSQSSSVTTHMRTHSGERPYRCRLCKKAFSDSSTLTKHLRIHSGEKPYQCKLCLLRFSQSGNLNRHMRVHNTSSNGLLPP